VTTPNSLQQITDAWAAWAAKLYNAGGYKYSASTDYQPVLGNDPQYQKYLQYQVTAVSSPIAYGNPTSISPGDAVSNTQGTTDNVGSQNLVQTINFSETTTQSFNVSVTETAQVGSSVTVEASIPQTAKVAGTASYTLSLSSTQGYSFSKQKTWSTSLTVTVPPGQRGVAMMTVNTQSCVVPWTCSVVLTGSVAVWFNNKVTVPPSKGSHNLYFFPIGGVFQDCINNKIIDTTGYVVQSDETVVAQTAGNFSGSGGVGYTSKAGEVSASSPPGTLPAEWVPAYPAAVPG
jgi:hypothetical protein